MKRLELIITGCRPNSLVATKPVGASAFKRGTSLPNHSHTGAVILAGVVRTRVLLAAK